jgi:hypothetical protein
MVTRRRDMNTTIRGHNLRVTVVVALLAVLLLLAVALVFALRLTPTTSDRDANPANHAMSADGKRGSNIPQNPFVERHAEVVERLGNGSL